MYFFLDWSYFLLMATKSTAETALKSRRKAALVIGIGRYDHIEGLKNPENDANDMSDALESIDFLVTKKLNVERRKMKYGIIDFEESIKPGDMVLFYFAGHGTQWEVCIENLSVKGIPICYG